MRLALASGDRASGRACGLEGVLAQLVGRSRHDWVLVRDGQEAAARGAAALLAPLGAVRGCSPLPVVALAGPGALPLERGVRRRVELLRRASSRPAHLLATSPRVHAALPGAELLRPGLDPLPPAPPPSAPRERLLLVAGPLCPAARAEVAVDAFRLAVAAGFRGRLVLAGPVAPAHRRLVGALRERAAGLAVTVLPDPGPAVLHALLARATALLAPALEDAGALAREALALGTPVLACADGPDRSTVLHDRTGWLLAPDARSLAHQALMVGVCSAQDMAPVRAACAARAASWTWDDVVGRLDDVLELAGLGLPVAPPVPRAAPSLPVRVRAALHG